GKIARLLDGALRRESGEQPERIAPSGAKLIVRRSNNVVDDGEAATRVALCVGVVPRAHASPLGHVEKRKGIVEWRGWIADFRDARELPRLFGGERRCMRRNAVLVVDEPPHGALRRRWSIGRLCHRHAYTFSLSLSSHSIG